MALSMLVRYSGLQWLDIFARGIADEDKSRDVKLHSMETIHEPSFSPILPEFESAKERKKQRPWTQLMVYMMKYPCLSSDMQSRVTDSA